MMPQTKHFCSPVYTVWENQKDYWQHMGGRFNWKISGDNVSSSCAALNVNIIIWPNAIENIASGGGK